MTAPAACSPPPHCDLTATCWPGSWRLLPPFPLPHSCCTRLLHASSLPRANCCYLATPPANRPLQVYGVLPDQLPTALRQELQQALCCSPTILLGAVRSGCTHLTASLLLSGAEAAVLQQPAGAAEALARLLQAWRQEQAGWRLPAELPLLRVVAQAETSSGALLLQPLMPQLQATPGSGPAASRLGATGGTVRVVSMADAEDAQLQRRRLQLTAVGPSATTVSTAGGRFQLHCQDWQQLLLGESSSGSSRGSRVLHCRRGGQHVAVALLHPGSPSDEREEEAAEQADPCSVADAAAEAAAASEEEEEEEQRLLQLLAEHPGAEVWLPEAERRWGLYEFELASGGWAGGWVGGCGLACLAACSASRGRLGALMMMTAGPLQGN